MSFTAFVDGPFWYFSATVFLIGVLWRLVGMLSMGSKPDFSTTPRKSRNRGRDRHQPHAVLSTCRFLVT